MIFTVGRVCLKIAGRDAGKHGVVIDVLDNHFVLVDGQTRRKKVNVKHLEPLNKIVEIKTGASHEQVVNVLTEAGINIVERKPKQAAEKPTKQKKIKSASVKGSPTEEKKNKKAADKKKDTPITDTAKETPTTKEKKKKQTKEE